MHNRLTRARSREVLDIELDLLLRLAETRDTPTDQLLREWGEALRYPTSETTDKSEKITTENLKVVSRKAKKPEQKPGNKLTGRVRKFEGPGWPAGAGAPDQPG